MKQRRKPLISPKARLGLGMLALSLGFPLAGYGVGILVINPKIVPERIAAGEKATLTIESRDGFQKPLIGVIVKVTAHTGYFEANHKKIILGVTDDRGLFQVLWHSDSGTAAGPQEFTILASKSGYIGKYPVTARVIVEDDGNEDPRLPSGR